MRGFAPVKRHVCMECAADISGWAAGPRAPMPSLLPSRTCDEPLANIARLCWHVLKLVWNVRVQSDDLLSRGVLRPHGARVQPVREIRQLFGATRLALCFRSPVLAPS